MSNASLEKYWTAVEIGEALGINPRKVYNLGISRIRVGRRVRFPDSAVRCYLKQNLDLVDQQNPNSGSDGHGDDQ